MRNLSAYPSLLLTALLALSPALAACGDDGAPPGATADASAGGDDSATADAVPPECTLAADCDTLLGAPACGAWACNAGLCEADSPGCTDADHDGYGTGAACACAGLDCDDSDDTIADTAAGSCYTAADPSTEGHGTCRAGTTTCSAGVWTGCSGEVGPSGEACNGEDDDCDDVDDDGLGMFSCGLGVCATSVSACAAGALGVCTPGAPASLTDGPTCDGLDSDCDGAIDEDCHSCIPVALTGNDTTADGTFLLPFRNVQTAIDWAATHAGPKTVCVAAGVTCGQTGTYANAATTTITMADGISVLGNYESTTWNHCANSTTVLQPKTAEGVTFPGTVTAVTVLDGFRIDRFQSATTAAITVNGAKNVILSSLVISNTPAVTNSYGVNIVNGGEATVTTRSHIDAGAGTGESIAVRAVGAKVTIANNCLSLDANGHCDDFCGANPSLRGRTTAGTGLTYAVLLSNAPGSTVESSALCAVDADVGAIIKIDGDATGVIVKGNTINAFGGAQDSYGIWMTDCNDAAPWIVDNQYITAAGDNQQTRVSSVRAEGACHPVIDSNVQITGGGEGQASNTSGVFCGANAAGVASRCVVLGNALIEGSDFGFPPSATGVHCQAGGCMRIAGNVITGRGGMKSIGVALEQTGALVENNLIRGGCSASAAGVVATDAFARLENNRIFGISTVDCTTAPPVTNRSVGLEVVLGSGTSELDVHSNTISALGAGACNGAAVVMDLGATAPSGGRGHFRNNILNAGGCSGTRYDFAELDVGADPHHFEHNLLDPSGTPTGLYFDENAMLVATAAAVDALVDMIVNGTLDLAPLFVAFPLDVHVGAGSPADAAGTPTGAPLVDMDGDARDALAPDIGADEI